MLEHTGRFRLFTVLAAVVCLTMLFPYGFGCSSGHKSGRGGIPGTSTGTGNGTGTGTGTGSGSGTGTGGGTGGSGGSGGPLGVNSIANGYSYAPDSYVDGGDPYPLIFILHGLGDDPKNLLLIWSSVAKAHNYLLCSLKASDTGNVMAMLEHMKQNYNVRLDKIAVFGFSNGAMFCCNLAFRFVKNPFSAMIACSGWPMGQDAPSTGMPAYIMWGEQERSSDKANCQKLADLLKSKGWDVTTRVHSSGHTVPQSEIPAMGDWLDSKIP
jgi:predicted esterase